MSPRREDQKHPDKDQMNKKQKEMEPRNQPEKEKQEQQKPPYREKSPHNS